MSAPLHLVALVRAMKDPIDRIRLAELLAEQALPGGSLPDRVDLAHDLLRTAEPPRPSEWSPLVSAMVWLDTADAFNPETTDADGEIFAVAVAKAAVYLDEVRRQYGMKAAA